MNKRHWNLIKSVVDEALTYSGDERDVYLKTILEEKPAIANEVLEMLSLIEEAEAEHFMQNVKLDGEKLLSELTSDFSLSETKKSYIGKKVGNYNITQLLAVGGMGVVFKASRTDGEFNHEVAVKILKSGFDSDENIHRFRIEREILASLNHPNIGQIYDGGFTNEGLPYLVMELIEGKPIHEYCNEKKLILAERIKIFAQICRAIDFAHKNLVIHRDLKAPNIYVTTNGVVKILDFGIAKLLDSERSQLDLTETLPGQKFWTPYYASPEQVRGDQMTTSTDVYSLGVLLHYLLTDTYPFDLDEKNIHDIEQIILERDPLPPSRAIKESGNIDDIAKSRSANITSLIKPLEAELDAMVLKSLRKDPRYRYNSVSQLIEELERFEAGKPLLAKSDSARYRMNKFMRRNRNILSIAALFLITIVGFSFIYTWNITQERNIAELERNKAEQAVDFLTSLFSAGNPVKAQGEILTAIDLLEIGIERAENLSDQPLLQADMLYAIGSSFRGMVMPDKAAPLLKESLELQRKHLPDDHPDIAFTLNALGSVYWSVDKDLLAEPYLYESLEMRKRLHGDNHPDVFTSLNNYALVLKDLGRLDEAENIYRENLEARKAYYGPIHSKVTYSLNNLAFLLAERGKIDEAEHYYREGLDAVRVLQGEDHSDVAIYLNNLGDLLQKQGKLDEAEEMIRESIRIRESVYGENHSNVSRSLNVLAGVLREKKDFDAAEDAANRSLEILTAIYDEDHTHIANTLAILGDIYQQSGNPEKAEVYLLESLQMRQRLYPNGNIDLAISYNRLGYFYLNTDRPVDAVPHFTNALKMYREISPSAKFTIARVQHNIGRALLETGHYSDSEVHLLNAYNFFAESDNISSSYYRRALQHLIALYRDWDKIEQAKLFENELAAL